MGETQPSDRTVDGMELPPARAQARVTVQTLQRLVGQVLQARTAVDQQQLGGDRAHPLVGARRAVAPSLQLGKDALLGEFHGRAADYAPGEGKAVEAAETMKRIEAAEEIAVGGDIGPYGLVHPARPGPAESGAVLTDQPHPFLLGPPPVGGALLRAPAQHQSDRILGRTTVERGVTTVAQREPRRVQRCKQASDRAPLRPRGIVAPTSPELPSQRRQCLPLASGQHGGAVERDDVEEWRRAHARPAGSAAASMAMRQLWICAMPCASLPASSRPERWTY